jgi:GNAT superfamily N-acetyltransferase
MRLERLNDSNIRYFDDAISLYENSFPREERRDMEELKRVLRNERYHFDFVLRGDTLCAIAFYWELDGLIFLEHLAVMENMRSLGVGTRILDLLKEKNKTIVLEIEPPMDEITERRYNFYKRSGFVMNPYYHIQAKFHVGDPDLELKILSYPAVLQEKLYTDFYEYMKKEIACSP